MKNKFTATWVSHSSMNDFLNCPRLYYLRNVYKDPKTRHKVAVINPALALGMTVHDVIERLSTIPTADRFKESLVTKFEDAWKKVSGKKGGFFSESEEATYKERGLKMIRRVQDNPGPLKNLAVKINMDLPHYWLSEDEEIILCGKIDWLEYLPDKDKVHIIDFKSSKKEEDPKSLQLPIYTLLVANCQKRKTDSASYWYLDFSDNLTPKELPDLEEAHERVIKIAREVKLARKLEKFECPQGDQGCYHCKDYEKIIAGKAEYVGENDFGQDLYVILPEEEQDSVIL